ncbi:HET-domain-containing protein [Corynespora cassiicola Philippines]|uniref:HET-domain-containing protein n=1 Tax=Corynespora cassiicola Philippines TaxID=1448308 RepID=A0A2T2N718_CORCC|nr:HET-domain-containing protein [Corynespora cassiicola Philippines]
MDDEGLSREFESLDIKAPISELPPYIYTPIEVGHFRVVTILPGAFEDDIQIEITEVDGNLSQELQYEALSYVWGSEEKPKKIYVIERGLQSIVSVTQNLAEALPYLRHFDAPRKIFVDAICINQNDTNEKNEQVLRMAEIYRKASNVIVWLGVETENTAHGLEIIIEAYKSIPYRGESWVPTIRSILAMESKTYQVDSTWINAINDIVFRPWFRRLWVLQEISVSKTAIVIIGKKKMSWFSLVAGIRRICWNKSILLQANTHALWTAQTAFELRHIANFCPESYYNLPQLYGGLRSFRCKDDRDKIYATRMLNTQLRNWITPDYSEANITSHVYTSLSIKSIKSKNTSSLRHANFSSKRSDTPSWVPNWAFYDLTPWPAFECISISANSVAKAEILRGENLVLSIDGLEIGQIISSCDFPERSDASIYDRRKLENGFLISFKKLYEDITNKPLSIDHLTRLLFLDQFKESYQSPVNLRSREKGRTRIWERIESPEVSQEMLWEKWSSDGSLFITQEGRIGVGAKGIKVGDTVCVLLGTDPAFVIRALEGTGRHIMIGWCALENILYGEALLGTLPVPWQAVCTLKTDPFGKHLPGWRNKETREVIYGDPRLPEADKDMYCEWEDTPGRFYWHGDEWRAEDPRLTSDFFRARGLDIKTFEFV